MNSRQIGNFGEKIAENYLKNKEYQILDRNYSSRSLDGPLKGEIDLVAKKFDIISFIEVKTLKGNGEQFAAIAPEDKVNLGKQRKLVRAAESWLMKRRIPLDTKWQIDVIAITLNSNKKINLSHFPNAIPY